MNRFDANMVALDADRWENIQNLVQQILQAIDEKKLFSSFPNMEPEITRLQRAIEYLTHTISSAQPYADLIAPEITHLVTNFENRLAQLNSRNQNQYLGEIEQINNEVTQILIRVSPFLSKSESAKSAGQAFYRLKMKMNTVEEEIEGLRDEARSSIAAVNQANVEITEYRDELLVDSDDRVSVARRTAQILEEMQQKLAATEHFFKKLKEGDGGSASIEYQIHEALSKSLEDSESISTSLEDTSAKLRALDKIHDRVVGTRTSEGHLSNGLAEQLELRGQQLETMIEDYDGKHKTLFDKIESLLPGATSAGLSTAYSELRGRAETSERFYSIAFYIGVVGLILIAAMSVTQTISLQPFRWEFIAIDEASEYLNKVLFKLPFVIPILWATLTLSKRRSEMHRLAEEYAHKEALAKSYEGFKRQAAELGQSESKLISQLLEVILTAMAKNPAQTLEGKHGDKLPTSEVLAALEGLKPK